MSTKRSQSGASAQYEPENEAVGSFSASPNAAHFGSLAFSTSARGIDDHCVHAARCGRVVEYSDDTGFVYVEHRGSWDDDARVWS